MLLFNTYLRDRLIKNTYLKDSYPILHRTLLDLTSLINTLIICYFMGEILIKVLVPLSSKLKGYILKMSGSSNGSTYYDPIRGTNYQINQPARITTPKTHTDILADYLIEVEPTKKRLYEKNIRFMHLDRLSPRERMMSKIAIHVRRERRDLFRPRTDATKADAKFLRQLYAMKRNYNLS